jgi:hypothetical protein
MSIVSTILFLIVIWMGVDSMLHSDRSELVASVPAALAGGWVWFLVRKKLHTLWQILLTLFWLFAGAGILGASQDIVMSRAHSITNSDRYDFLAGSIIPALIAVAAWCFLKEKRKTPKAN